MREKIYFDYASTTPVEEQVLEEMLPYFVQRFGNSESWHRFGREAREGLEEARGKVASLIGARPQEIVFTSSATESNNLALKGIAFANRKKGRHLIISAVEHACVLEAARWLERGGFKITRLPVDKHGVVSPDEVREALRPETVLVSVMHANNEIGSINPIEEIGQICREQGVYFHTDAAQTFGKLPLDMKRAPIDLLTASSHKTYGPKGAAFLFIKEGVEIEPLLHGGGQERGLRSSTVNLPAIVGLAKAAEISYREASNEQERLTRLRNRLVEGVLSGVPGAHLTGHPQRRLANLASFWFEGVEGDGLVLKLDRLGFAVSTGSACSTSKMKPSHVLLALGLTPEQARGSLRVSLGRWTKEGEVEHFLEVLPKAVAQLRRISS